MPAGNIDRRETGCAFTYELFRTRHSSPNDRGGGAGGVKTFHDVPASLSDTSVAVSVTGAKSANSAVGDLRLGPRPVPGFGIGQRCGYDSTVNGDV